MRLLLDTHIALWAVTASPRLSAQVQSLILRADEVHVGAATLWEIAIPHALARGDRPVSAALALQAFRCAGYQALNVALAHVLAVERLPAWHQDPFDRLRVAQAVTKPLRLPTADAALARYSDLVVVVQRQRPDAALGPRLLGKTQDLTQYW